jgi:hypothetical protein
MPDFDRTIDLEEAILAKDVADRQARAEMRAAPKTSTSVLLPPSLKRMKNGELIGLIQVWLDSVDTKVLIQQSLEYALENISRHRAAQRNDPNGSRAIYTGYAPIVFHASCRLEPGSRDQMAQHKKTITLPVDMRYALIDAAVDLGVSLGEMVRIAVTHTYLVKTPDGYSVTFEPGKRMEGNTVVAQYTTHRQDVYDARSEQEANSRGMAEALTRRK